MCLRLELQTVAPTRIMQNSQLLICLTYQLTLKIGSRERISLCEQSLHYLVSEVGLSLI